MLCCHLREGGQASGFSRSICVVMDDERQFGLPAILDMEYMISLAIEYTDRLPFPKRLIYSIPAEQCFALSIIS